MQINRGDPEACAISSWLAGRSAQHFAQVCKVDGFAGSHIRQFDYLEKYVSGSLKAVSQNEKIHGHTR